MKSRVLLVLIMGVAGSGKTTVGRMLADELGWEYFEADDFHPPANVAKMSRGEPLTDADRGPWLERIHRRMRASAEAGVPGVFTCSALKRTYREALLAGLPGVLLVHLQADAATITTRVRARQGHFMKAEMVPGQFAALELPEDALTVDARRPPREIVRCIRAALAS